MKLFLILFILASGLAGCSNKARPTPSSSHDFSDVSDEPKKASAPLTGSNAFKYLQQNFSNVFLNCYASIIQVEGDESDSYFNENVIPNAKFIESEKPQSYSEPFNIESTRIVSHDESRIDLLNISEPREIKLNVSSKIYVLAVDVKSIEFSVLAEIYDMVPKIAETNTYEYRQMLNAPQIKIVGQLTTSNKTPDLNRNRKFDVDGKVNSSFSGTLLLDETARLTLAKSPDQHIFSQRLVAKCNLETVLKQSAEH